MTTAELRQKYLDFFKSKGHTVIPSASLIPDNDPTVLFTTAGMHPLVPYLMGQVHQGGKRLTDVQKCVRTGDIDEVGDAWHLTFFEMLGNWSLGDYFKKEAIAWSWEFLTSKSWLGLDPKMLAVSVFAGDENAPRDEEAADVWKSLGVHPSRIAYLPKENNWWGPAGLTGPCGPDTEMFYWTPVPEPLGGTGTGQAGFEPPPDHFDPSDPRWVEIWNDVFMQYEKTVEGNYIPLKQKNVDTGMGLERTTAILNGFKSVYEIDTFETIIKKIELLVDSTLQTTSYKLQALRIIADHIRAATFIMADRAGVVPSNVERGYVVRRLIRRAIRHGSQIGITRSFCHELALDVIRSYGDVYPELKENQKHVIDEFQKEEAKFARTLEHGMKEFERLTASGTLTGEQVFDLYQSYGFPIEVTEELVRERGLTVDRAAFDAAFIKHQEISRVGAAQRFKGGLADTSWASTRYHTATHLIHEALRRVLGTHVQQKGSNITQERLRFDFLHPQKMTPDEISKVEEIVNEQIQKNLPVHYDLMTLDEAKAAGAIGLFEDEYAKLGGKIKVYSVGRPGDYFSREVCGGPHVALTGKIGYITIIKEEAIAAGIRRIKARVTGETEPQIASEYLPV